MHRSKGQMGLVEAFVGHRLGANDRLERIDALVKWYRFEKMLGKLHGAKEGRPAYPPLMMLKALLLQQWYGLSDAGLEEALNDRISFRRFVGLELTDDAPDHTTICRFRNQLAQAGLSERLFEEMNRQLDGLGVILRRGTLIDATLVEAAVRPGPSAEQAKDTDAAFARRQGKAGSTFGYKAHIAVDEGSGLIRAALLTPANVNETVVADALVQGDEKAIYADQAYDTHARRAMLKSRGIKARLMHRPNKHHPVLSRWKQRRNRLIASIRGRVETVFGVWKRHYRYRAVRYVGLMKNQSHLQLLCLAFNLRRITVIPA